MPKVDYLVVGAGLFGAVFTRQARRRGKRCLVIDKRDHIGGNCYTERQEGIHVHKHGAHIFHTDDLEVWEYVNSFEDFNGFINQPIAIVKEQAYNLPFNMNMFARVFGIYKPSDVKDHLDYECSMYKDIEPKNLEEQALKLVGKTVYNMFVKEYTEKQWGKKCTELPASTIKRLPIRFTYDNNYFTDKYQGVPKGGYTSMIEGMLECTEVRLGVSYREIENHIDCDKVIYTGMIDEFFDYEYGELEYRSLKFEEVVYNTDNYQGNAVVNFPEAVRKPTRAIEHRHFYDDIRSKETIVSYEYPEEFKHLKGMTPYYPIGNEENMKRYRAYEKLSSSRPDIHFKGRLGKYRYYDMDDTVKSALSLSKELN